MEYGIHIEPISTKANMRYVLGGRRGDGRARTGMPLAEVVRRRRSPDPCADHRHSLLSLHERRLHNVGRGVFYRHLFMDFILFTKHIIIYYLLCQPTWEVHRASIRSTPATTTTAIPVVRSAACVRDAVLLAHHLHQNNSTNFDFSGFTSRFAISLWKIENYGNEFHFTRRTTHDGGDAVLQAFLWG